jgi:hypothetical protein
VNASFGGQTGHQNQQLACFDFLKASFTFASWVSVDQSSQQLLFMVNAVMHMLELPRLGSRSKIKCFHCFTPVFLERSQLRWSFQPISINDTVVLKFQIKEGRIYLFKGGGCRHTVFSPVSSKISKPLSSRRHMI